MTERFAVRPSSARAATIYGKDLLIFVLGHAAKYLDEYGEIPKQLCVPAFRFHNTEIAFCIRTRRERSIR